MTRQHASQETETPISLQAGILSEYREYISFRQYDSVSYDTHSDQHYSVSNFGCTLGNE